MCPNVVAVMAARPARLRAFADRVAFTARNAFDVEQFDVWALGVARMRRHRGLPSVKVVDGDRDVDEGAGDDKLDFGPGMAAVAGPETGHHDSRNPHCVIACYKCHGP